MYRCVRSLFVGRISGSRVPCRITNPDSNVGWVNVGPKLGLQFRRWANVGPTRIDVWEPWHNIIVMFNVIVCQICVDGVVATLRVCYFFCVSSNVLLPLKLSGRRGIVVACVCSSVCPSVRKLYLVRTITRHKFEPKSPNLHQACILWYSRLVLKMEVIDPDLQGHFGRFDLEF